LNGLLLDGAGTGETGIFISSGASVQILNSVVRHFLFGIFNGTTTNGSKLLIEDTVASDNMNTGIDIAPNVGTAKATLNRVTANNNASGIVTNGGDTTIANSVMSNNSNIGLNIGGVTWLAKSVISANETGISVGGTANTYGDNYIADNVFPIANGGLNLISMR
jgi:hypothetical protein